MEWPDLCSSSPHSSASNRDSTEEHTLEDGLVTQLYLFEPYDSEASPDTDSTNKWDDCQGCALRAPGYLRRLPFAFKQPDNIFIIIFFFI